MFRMHLNPKTLSEANEFIKYEQVTNQSDRENIRLINMDGNTQNLMSLLQKCKLK